MRVLINKNSEPYVMIVGYIALEKKQFQSKFINRLIDSLA